MGFIRRCFRPSPLAATAPLAGPGEDCSLVAAAVRRFDLLQCWSCAAEHRRELASGTGQPDKLG